MSTTGSPPPGPDYRPHSAGPPHHQSPDATPAYQPPPQSSSHQPYPAHDQPYPQRGYPPPQGTPQAPLQPGYPPLAPPQPGYPPQYQPRQEYPHQYQPGAPPQDNAFHQGAWPSSDSPYPGGATPGQTGSSGESKLPWIIAAVVAVVALVFIGFFALRPLLGGSAPASPTPAQPTATETPAQTQEPGADPTTQDPTAPPDPTEPATQIQEPGTEAGAIDLNDLPASVNDWELMTGYGTAVYMRAEYEGIYVAQASAEPIGLDVWSQIMENPQPIVQGRGVCGLMFETSPVCYLTTQKYGEISVNAIDVDVSEVRIVTEAIAAELP